MKNAGVSSKRLMALLRKVAPTSSAAESAKTEFLDTWTPGAGAAGGAVRALAEDAVRTGSPPVNAPPGTDRRAPINGDELDDTVGSWPRPAVSASESRQSISHSRAPTTTAQITPTDPIAVLVLSMLMWESTTDKAAAAYARLMENVVDFNDLRVCLPHETVDLIGPRYPRALDRAHRLRAVLKDIYLREHAVSLQRITSNNKREMKKYIDTLEGIVPYAASRTLLLCYGAHTIPVDDQLRAQLIDAEVIEPSIELPELSNWLAAQVKPGEALATHWTLQSWIDEVSAKGAPGERKATPKRNASRKPAAKRA